VAILVATFAAAFVADPVVAPAAALVAIIVEVQVGLRAVVKHLLMVVKQPTVGTKHPGLSIKQHMMLAAENYTAAS